jgi:hypothetical protein
MSPPVEIQQRDNGGILSTDLTYPEAEAEVVDERPKVGFQTEADDIGTQMHNNLVPSARFKKAWSKDIQIGAQSNVIVACYLERISKDGFKYRSLPDLKAGDYDRMMTTIPEPWVEHKAYPLSSYTKHKHPVNPTGLDEDDLLSHKVPAEALTKSDALAKQQLQVRAQLVKLHLPAAELARWLHRKTEPLESPAALKAWSLDGYDVVRGDEQPHTGPETERFEGCVHSYVSYLHELLWSLSDRNTLTAHTACVLDYDLQMQRVHAVAPQSSALAQALRSAGRLPPRSRRTRTYRRGTDESRNRPLPHCR